MTMSPFWIVLAFTLCFFIVHKVLLLADDITAYEYLLTFHVF